MTYEMRVPRLSIPELGPFPGDITVVGWNKRDREHIYHGEVLVELESTLSNIELYAEHDGVLSIGRQSGEIVKAGDVIGKVLF